MRACSGKRRPGQTGRQRIRLGDRQAQLCPSSPGSPCPLRDVTFPHCHEDHPHSASRTSALCSLLKGFTMPPNFTLRLKGGQKGQLSTKLSRALGRCCGSSSSDQECFYNKALPGWTEDRRAAHAGRTGPWERRPRLHHHRIFSEDNSLPQNVTFGEQEG